MGHRNLPEGGSVSHGVGGGVGADRGNRGSRWSRGSRGTEGTGGVEERSRRDSA